MSDIRLDAATPAGAGVRVGDARGWLTLLPAAGENGDMERKDRLFADLMSRLSAINAVAGDRLLVICPPGEAAVIALSAAAHHGLSAVLAPLEWAMDEARWPMLWKTFEQVAPVALVVDDALPLQNALISLDLLEHPVIAFKGRAIGVNVILLSAGEQGEVPGQGGSDAMKQTLVIPARFAGPPAIANGGYVAGLLAELVGAGYRFDFRAPVPLDVELELSGDSPFRLSAEGKICVEATEAPPGAPIGPPPNLDVARRAGSHPLETFHTSCVCCSPVLPPHATLGVRVGVLGDEGSGEVAGIWRPTDDFADADGRIPAAMVWVALDCPGFYAWVAREGKHFALTGSMAGEVYRTPEIGEECIVFATVGEQVSERRREATVGLFSQDGTLMAQMWQTWVRMRRKEGPQQPVR